MSGGAWSTFASLYPSRRQHLPCQKTALDDGLRHPASALDTTPVPEVCCRQCLHGACARGPLSAMVSSTQTALADSPRHRASAPSPTLEDGSRTEEP